MRQPFRERLQSEEILVLDGATGTELERRGFQLNAPGWSASAIREAPELLLEIHRDYIAAGAEIVTTNTFRTHNRNLGDTKWAGESRVLTIEAVKIARQAAGEAYVAGSIAPLEDCYSPQLTPPQADLEKEHQQMVENLIAAGVDLIIAETQLTIRESETIARICSTYPLPFILSFTCGRDGKLLSGESLAAAAEAVLLYSPAALLVNCLPVEEVLDRMIELRSVDSRIPLGAYANSGRLRSDGTWESTLGINPAVYAEFAQTWKEFGIRIVGGCCGTTPRHVSCLIKMV
ncbi:MAG: homocysteine S-methyltransferase family protein [Planctomicrobium sp.]|jgi:homocysteine S-methyltransferase|nr:homocysteine S-methyltransferase family protein [Planctomicrobium sp.]